MIRLAVAEELPRIMEVFDAGRAFMRANGNDAQWIKGYPQQEMLLDDIKAGTLHVMEEDGRICGCFVLAEGPDPTYTVITDGNWGADTSYGVIHRIASDGTTCGVLAKAVDFAAQRFDHLRVDTHEKNIPMQGALGKQGFTCRGTIFTHDGTPRLAFDRF